MARSKTICKECYWKQKGMLSGQGFTKYTCALCGNEYEWCNTDVPKICEECSKKMNICQRCLEPLDDKEKE